MIFAAGTYTVTFDLAGSQGGVGFVDGTPKTTEIAFSIGGMTQSLTLDPLAVLAPYSFTFTTTDSGHLSFTDLSGGNGNVGNLLDNVSVSAVPESSTWAMMILGFLSIGVIGYRRKQRGGAFRIA
jgi:hypothetical protein